MNASRGRLLVVFGLLLAVAACAPVRVRQTPATLAAQAAREAQLGQRKSWALSAHVFVSDGDRNSGSGDLEWRQSGDRYDFVLRAPTGRTWKLSGDSRGATLVGVDPQPLHGNDPERLLRDRLGWDVPVDGLAEWVRGMRETGSAATLQFDEQGLPAVLDQGGWTIQYRDWFGDKSPPLPRKVYASSGKARVKMAIESWSFDG